MVAAISLDRWMQAQGAELSFWTGMDLHELVKACAEKIEFWSQFEGAQIDALLGGREVLEIGCGPLGLSLVSFAGRGGAVKRLVKTDPLPRLSVRGTNPAREAWAGKLFEWIEELAADGEYAQMPGEELAFDSCFDTVVSYNVLDHVRTPGTILKNAHRALRPGGTLLVGVDCLSWLGRARFELLTRRRARGSILVEAHPHTFLPRHVTGMIGAAGFRLTAVLGVPGRMRQLAGRHFRPAFLATK